MTQVDEWCIVKGKGRKVDPVPIVGESEEYKVKVTDEELADLMDDYGDIRYYKVLLWSLPQFEGESPEFCDWLAARMKNYMAHLIETGAYKPRFYDPENGTSSLATMSRSLSEPRWLA